MNSAIAVRESPLLNKVPEVVLAFWLIKILSTTVGETAADALSSDAMLGAPLTGLTMALLLGFFLWRQMRRPRLNHGLYWTTVVLVSIVGTQITDALTDSLGVSLYASTAGFSLLLAGVFALWWKQEGTLSIRAIDTRRREAFYWLAILCTFALGTAAGDLATEALGLGFLGGAVAFGALIAVIAGAWRFGASPVLVFWPVYILTRPLGAALGDLLTQSDGGWGLDKTTVSVAFLAAIVGLVAWSARQAARRALAGAQPAMAV